MKNFFKILLLILSVFTSRITAQNTFSVSGNAGVGTSSPTVPFEIGTTLTQGATIFKFSNPQQNNQILFKDRDFSNFLYGIQSNQIKIGATGYDHKIMSIQSNANNITLWPVLSVNSSSNIIINPTGNVGVGQSSPVYKLDVNGSVNANQYYINGSPLSGLTSLWLTSPSNTNNAYYNNGNIGIGTNNPTVPFQIGTTLSQGSPVFNFGNPQQYNQIIFRDRSNSSFLYGVESGQVKIGLAGSDHKIMSTQYNAQNIELWPTVAINTPSNVLINAGQNVGIGNSNPQHKLDVSGPINATQYLVNGNPLATLSGTGNTLYVPASTSLGIGTASPAYLLDVAGDARIQNNLYVGGGIVITDNLNAAQSVTTGVLNADTINMSNGGTVRGDVNATDKLSVAGKALFTSTVTVGNNLFFGGANSNRGISYTPPIGNTPPIFGWGGPFIGIPIEPDYLCAKLFASEPIVNQFGDLLQLYHITQPSNSYVAGSPILNIGAATNESYINSRYAPLTINEGCAQPVYITPNGGNIGFGTSTTSERFHFSNGNVIIDDLNSIGNAFRMKIQGGVQPGLCVTSSNVDAIVVQDAGNSNLPNFKVKTNGIVYAREVIVTLNAFPDYVFSNKYKLPELSELKAYIKKNNKLPNMPAASEVEKNGANLGEVQKITVEKLEEAYLYIFQLEEKIKKLSDKLDALDLKTSK